MGLRRDQAAGQAAGRLGAVSFFLVCYGAGRLGEISPEMRREIAEARWLPLADAESLLAYAGEREMALKARELLEAGEANRPGRGAPRRLDVTLPSRCQTP